MGAKISKRARATPPTNRSRKFQCICLKIADILKTAGHGVKQSAI